MEAFLESRISHDDVRLRYCYSHFQANIRDIVATAHRSGAKTLICTVPTNIASCAPFGSQHQKGLTQAQTAEWDRLFQAGRTLEKRGDFQAALTEYQKAQAIDDAYADLSFCMGKCILALGRVHEAKTLLTGPGLSIPCVFERTARSIVSSIKRPRPWPGRVQG